MQQEAEAAGSERAGGWLKAPRGRRRLALLLATCAAVGMFAALAPAGTGVRFLAAQITSESRALLADLGLAPPLAQARQFNGTPAIGALFTLTSAGSLGSHFCTGSVIDSPQGDIVLTAAHCLSDRGGRLAFVPGYNKGHAPYGIWRVTKVTVDRNWATSANPDDDFALLVVSGPGGRKIQDVTGGERLGTATAAGDVAEVPGYPGSQDEPILCQSRVLAFSATQLEFDCGGYTDGTSGSPLLVHVSSSTGLGTVVGVIGGYEQGGYSASVSYAARFGARLLALYKTATA